MIQIDRVVVYGGALSPGDAARFAELLGAELGRLVADRAAGGAPAAAGPISVSVSGGSGLGVARLAAEAAAEVAAALWTTGAR